MDSRDLGIRWESRKDNGDDSKPIDWGFIFMLLKNRGFSHDEILKLSYPQFNAYMNNINNELSYNIVVPYLGGKKDEKQEEGKIETKEELLSIIANMNNDFR